MAHAIAANRVGARVVALIDTDEFILETAQKRWQNRWGGYMEGCDPHKGTIYDTEIRRLDNSPDLVILATPPKTHDNMLVAAATAWPDAHVIIEKPLFLQDRAMIYAHRASMSCEWLYHTQAAEAMEAGSLGMSFPHPIKKREWHLPLVHEFAPHLLAMLASFAEIDEIQVIHSVEDAFSLLVHTSHGKRGVWGDRTSAPGIYFNEDRYGWEVNLFDKQIIAGGGAGILKMMNVETLLCQALAAHDELNSAPDTV